MRRKKNRYATAFILPRQSEGSFILIYICGKDISVIFFTFLRQFSLLLCGMKNFIGVIVVSLTRARCIPSAFVYFNYCRVQLSTCTDPNLTSDGLGRLLQQQQQINRFSLLKWSNLLHVLHLLDFS